MIPGILQISNNAKGKIRIRIKSEKPDLDKHESNADPQH